MDYFSFCLDGLCLAGQSILHILFVSRLTGKKQRTWYFAAYFILLGATEWLFTRYIPSGIPAVCAEVLILYGMSRALLGNRRSAAGAAAVLAVYISQLSFGIVNPAEAMIFPFLIGTPLLYPMVIFATLAAFAVCIFCYAAVLKLLSLADDGQMPSVGALVLPGVFFFASEWYILRTSYGGFPSACLSEGAGTHGALLLLQLLGLAALLCTLRVYQHLRQSLQAQEALRSLAQAAQAQRTYIAEAQARYDRTRAFRHDIRNHLSVLSGLLNSGKTEESKAYLQKLEAASAMLSLPCQTGNPVVDVLLGEKLERAKAEGISSDVALLLPRPCGVDDFDLCVIFANALDNAIQACQKIEGAKSIHIRGERQGDFYMLAFENTCPDEPLPPAGTGLSNIRSVAEKYHGAMLVEKNRRCFCLNVLLNISLHPESIWAQKP